LTEQNNQENSSGTTDNPSMEWDIDNLPNRLTIFRLILVPLVVAALMFNLDIFDFGYELKSTLGWTAAWIFVAASVTDFFDGYIARKRKIVTVFGSFLDPIADKFLVVSSILMLQALDRIHVLLVIVLVLREFYITSLRLLAGDRGFKIPVGQMGKWKTATQMVGIPMLMANEPGLGIPFPIIGTIAIYLSGIISVYSATDYSLSLLKKIREHRKEKKQ
jgi:CDP-diacylglycerol--glycerol-3-phosphate 3-phosphatidyltransferase